MKTPEVIINLIRTGTNVYGLESNDKKDEWADNMKILSNWGGAIKEVGK